MSVEVMLLIFAVVGALIFASAVAALTWAFKNGQFDRIQRGATSIFDEEEPLGLRTDAFPGEGKDKRATKKKPPQRS